MYLAHFRLHSLAHPLSLALSNPGSSQLGATPSFGGGGFGLFSGPPLRMRQPPPEAGLSNLSDGPGAVGTGQSFFDQFRNSEEGRFFSTPSRAVLEVLPPKLNPKTLNPEPPNSNPATLNSQP